MINLKDVKKKLKDVLVTPREKDLMSKALKFADENAKVIILILDPKKDDIIAAYGKHYSLVNIRTKFLKRKVHVVREILKGKNVDRNINRVLHVMDAFLWNLAHKINKRSAKNNNKLIEKKKNYDKEKSS